MEKVSEVENLGNDSMFVINGPLKAIGVSSANLTPNEKGIVPLANQSAMLFETQEVQGMQEASVETLDLGDGSQPQINEAVYSETINTDPLNVADTSSLGGFDFSAPANTETATEPVAEETHEEEQAVEEIEMPVMPQEVLAQEPDAVDENIFAGQEVGGAPAEEEPAVNAQEPIENPLEKMEDLGVTEEDPVTEELATEETYEPEAQLDESQEYVSTDTTMSIPEGLAYEINPDALEELKNRIVSVIDDFGKELTAKTEEQNMSASTMEEPVETSTEGFNPEETNENDAKSSVEAAVEALKLPTQGEEETPAVPTAGPASEANDGLPELPEISVGPEVAAQGTETQIDNLMAAAMNQISGIGVVSQDVNDSGFVPDNTPIQGGKFGLN